MAFEKKTWQFNDIITEGELNRMEDGIEEGIAKAEDAKTSIESHENRQDNPHNVTKQQVGLGNVDNVKQASKSEFDAHVADYAAHGATASAIANRIVVRDESGGASFSHFGLSPTRSTTDLNDRLRNGWSSVDSNTPNTPEPGVQGVLFTSMWDNDVAGFQLFCVLELAGVVDKLYFRRRVNRTWFPWVKLWHSGNTIVDSNGFIKEV